MCLYVDSHFHPTNKPYVNKVPWVAWKMLHTYQSARTGLELRSPFRDFKWRPGRLEHRKLEDLRGYTPRQARIFKGLHGFRTENSCTAAGGSQIFPCLIPPGSEVFYGLHNDFVSSQLIVYETMQDLEACWGETRPEAENRTEAIARLKQNMSTPNAWHASLPVTKL